MRNFHLTNRDSIKLASMVLEISWSNDVIIMKNVRMICKGNLYLNDKVGMEGETCAD